MRYVFTSNAKAILMREKQNGMYSVSAYYVAKSVVELPHQVLSPILYSLMFYWMVGLQVNAGKFWTLSEVELAVVR